MIAKTSVLAKTSIARTRAIDRSSIARNRKTSRDRSIVDRAIDRATSSDGVTSTSRATRASAHTRASFDDARCTPRARERSRRPRRGRIKMFPSAARDGGRTRDARRRERCANDATRRAMRARGVGGGTRRAMQARANARGGRRRANAMGDVCATRTAARAAVDRAGVVGKGWISEMTMDDDVALDRGDDARAGGDARDDWRTRVTDGDDWVCERVGYDERCR
jgi:hypothetical protein